MDSRLKLIIKGDPEEVLSLLVRLKDPRVMVPDCQVIAQFGDIITCRVKRKHLIDVYNAPGTFSVKAPRVITSSAYGEEIQPADQEKEPGMPTRKLTIPYTGEDIYFATVDWGFDFAHKNLRNPDGTTRFKCLWDQNGIYDGNLYGYGCFYSDAEINEALKTDTPYQTLGYHPGQTDLLGSGMHGTHVIDIAAGTPAVGEGGLAPGSRIVGVQLGNNYVNGSDLALGDSVKLIEALHYIYSVTRDAPCVINMSLGSHGDSHTGKSLVEIAFDNFLHNNPGYAIVQSVGNYFTAHCHIQQVLKQDEKYSIEWNIPRRNFAPDEVEIWYPHDDEISLRLIAPDGDVVTDLEPFKDVQLSYEGEAFGYIFHRRNEPNTGLNHIDILMDVSIAKGKWIIELSGTKIKDGRFNAYCERNDASQSRFTVEQTTGLGTTGSVCNSKSSITVGAYNHLDASRPVVSFSSSGPTVFGQPKPDLLAPGYKIKAARSAAAHEFNAGNGLTIKSGSSMAAPHVAGSIILLYQQLLPERLSVQRLKELLKRSLDPLPPGFSENDRIRSGGGILNSVKLLEIAKNNKKDQGRLIRPLKKSRPLTAVATEEEIGLEAQPGMMAPSKAGKEAPLLFSNLFNTDTMSITQAFPGNRTNANGQCICSANKNGEPNEPLFLAGADGFVQMENPFNIYRHFHPKYSYRDEDLEKMYSSVLLPGERLRNEFQPADILLVRNILSGTTGKALIADPAIFAHTDLDGLSGSLKPGYYVQVFSSDSPNGRPKSYYRVADRNRTINDHIVIIRRKILEDLSNGYMTSAEKETEDFSEASYHEDDPSSLPALLDRTTVPAAETLYVNIDLGLRKECSRLDQKTYACTESLRYDVAPETGIYIPSAFRATAEIDILLYLHGFKSPYVQDGRDIPIDRFWDASVLPKFAFRELLNDCGNRLILVAPTLGPLSQAGTLTSLSGFEDFILKILESIKQYSSLYANQSIALALRNIILAAHSGGGKVMRSIASLAKSSSIANKISECWGFDCTYSSRDQEWYDWAAHNPDKSLYLFSISGSSTAINAAAIQSGRKALPNIHLADSNTQDHNSVPRLHLRERLQQLRLRSAQSVQEDFTETGNTFCTEYGQFITEADLRQKIADTALAELQWWQNGPSGPQILEGTTDGKARITAYWANIPNPPPHTVPSTAWSAIFVSSCVKMAADALDLSIMPLLLSSAHFRYAKDARNRRFNNPPQAGRYWAYDPSTRAVQVGDIIVKERKQPNGQFIGLTFNSLATVDGASTHGDIVVSLQANPNQANVVGGNVSDSVNQNSYMLTADGKIDTSQNHYSANRVFAVLSLEPLDSCILPPMVPNLQMNAIA